MEIKSYRCLVVLLLSLADKVMKIKKRRDASSSFIMTEKEMTFLVSIKKKKGELVAKLETYLINSF